MRIANGVPEYPLPSTSTAKLNATYAEAYETEHHLHTLEHWAGRSTKSSTGTRWADFSRNVPYRVHSGNNAFSTGSTSIAYVFGSGDTPEGSTSNTLYDLHTLKLVGVSNDNVFRFRFVFSTGTLAQGIAAKSYTETVLKFDATNPQQSAAAPFDVRSRRYAVGTKCWAQCKSTANNAYVDFFIGVHEYLL